MLNSDRDCPHVLQMEELKPYNEASKAQRADKTNFDSRWSDLVFKNEQQLDEVIASIDYRLSHQTNSVADEKKLIAELKKLGVLPLLRMNTSSTCSNTRRQLPRAMPSNVGYLHELSAVPGQLVSWACIAHWCHACCCVCVKNVFSEVPIQPSGLPGNWYTLRWAGCTVGAALAGEGIRPSKGRAGWQAGG